MMKYLFCLLFLFGCNWFGEEQSFSRNIENTSNSSGCSSECQQDCGEIFPSSGEFKACTRLSDQTVTRIKRAVDNMRRGTWDPINEEQIAFIVDISYSPWIEYADGSHESAENMLIWLAENHNMPNYLDKDGEILKTVLASLSYMSFDDGVKDALSKDIEDGRTFLEMMAWEKNNEGFRRTHNVILNVCDRDSICVRQTYCQNNSDIVPDTVNKLELNLDFQKFDLTCS